MEGQTLIITVVVAYLVLLTVLGIFLRRRIQGFADFIVAGRNVGLLVVTGSFVGSHFGGGMTVGGAEYGIIHGFSGIWYGVACGFSYLALLVIVKKIYALRQMTIADCLEHFYRTKRIRALFALLAFVSTLGIIGGQILAGGAIFANFGVPREVGGILTFLIIVLYCSLSGLFGVMITDVLQVSIGAFGVILASIVALGRVGGLSGLESLPAEKLALFPPELSALLWIIVPTTLNGLVSQPSYQRVNACRDEKVAFRAPLIAAFVVIVLAIFPVLAGMCANVLWPGIEPAAAIPQLLKEIFPPVVAAIFIAAILAAIMSTADSVLLAGTAFVARDLYQQIFKPGASDKHLLKVSTVLTVTIGLFALGVTYLFPVIIDLFLVSYAVMVCGGLIPVMGGFLWKKGTEKGAWASFLVGTTFVLLNVLNVIEVPYYYIVGLLPALLAYVVVSLLTDPVPDPA
jgi:SSS family solute:Na+ symporter